MMFFKCWNCFVAIQVLLWYHMFCYISYKKHSRAINDFCSSYFRKYNFRLARPSPNKKARRSSLSCHEATGHTLKLYIYIEEKAGNDTVVLANVRGEMHYRALTATHSHSQKKWEEEECSTLINIQVNGPQKPSAREPFTMC